MSKPKSCCPHCGKKDCFDIIAMLNAENYGGGCYNMMCKHCDNNIRVFLSRVVVIEAVCKGDKSDNLDF